MSKEELARELLEGQDDSAFDDDGNIVQGDDVQPEEGQEAAPAETPENPQAPPEPPPAAAETEEPPAPEQPSFVQRLSELGFQDVNDEIEAQARLVEAFEQQRRQSEELQRQYAQTQALLELQQSQRQQQQVTPEPQSSAPAESTKAWWEPPEFRQEWLQKYRMQDKESGEWQWKPETPAEIIDRTNEYQLYLERWADDLTTRPVEALRPFREEVLREAREMVGQILEERRTEESRYEFIERLRSENDWMFEKDPLTNQRTTTFSREGQRMMQFVDEAIDIGITEPEQQWKYASRMYQAEQAEATAGKSSAASNAEEMRKQHLRKATPVSNRSGSAPSREQSDERPRNVNQSPGRQFLDQLREDGVGIL